MRQASSEKRAMGLTSLVLPKLSRISIYVLHKREAECALLLHVLDLSATLPLVLVFFQTLSSEQSCKKNQDNKLDAVSHLDLSKPK